MADPIQDDEEAVHALARAIEGPHLPVPEGSKFTLEELREVRWKQLGANGQFRRIMQAHAAIAALSPRLSAAKEEGIREGMERCIQHFEAKAKGFREAAAVQKRRVGPLAAGYECAAKEITAIRREVSNG